MTIKLKQSTASQEIPLGYFVDSTDGNTEETGLTIANTDIKLWKMGATTLASKNSGGATHISNGIYYAVLDATDTDTLGGLVIFVHVAGALSVKIECEVLPANIYDSLIAGSDNLQVDAIQFAGQTITAAAGVTLPSSVASPTNITAGTITTVTNLTNAPTNGDLTATMKASVNTEADTALSDVGLTTTVTGRIDAAVTTRASQTSLDTLDDYVDTEVAAIKAKTDQLVFTVANQVDANALTNGGLSAADTRSAIGLASANLDTQLDALPTAAEIATAVWSAVTRTLTSISDSSGVTTLLSRIASALNIASGKVESNIKQINDTTITGDGSGTPWGPV